MNIEFHQRLYKDSTITLLESFLSIETFLNETRLPFTDQYKLFELLNKLLPNEDNQLSYQHFLSWLVQRFTDQENERKIKLNNRFCIDTENEDTTFHETSSLVKSIKREFNNQINHSSDVEKKIYRLQSIVLRLASTIDNLNEKQSNTSNSTPIYCETHAIKHEQIENEPSEHDMEENDDNDDDETLYTNQQSNTLPIHTQININRLRYQDSLKPLMYNGRNMMKHLRSRTTLTSFARHVASDLFNREEIMAKLHVDHQDERNLFLRQCICTAWNLTEQELYGMWPKIRNALLQLRRDAIAGKCIRMNGKRKKEHNDNSKCNSDSEDDDHDMKQNYV